MVTDEVYNLSSSRTETSPVNTTINSSFKSNANGNSKTALEMFNDSIGEVSSEVNQRDQNKKAVIIEELHNYRKYASHFNLNHKPDATSAIKFWKIYGNAFSNLKTLAKKMLSTPATSVPSESCFSISSFLGRKERSSLTGENLSLCVFLKDKIIF
jgi:hypothetical protein